MAITMSSATTTISGTNAERLALTTTALGSIQFEFFESDTNATYEWKGTEWEQTKTAGAQSIILSSPYPSGATAINAASGNVANANAVATLAAVAGKTTYITGFEVTGAGATAGLPVIVTVVGTITTTLSFIAVAAVGALVANTPVIVEFPVPIPASATNTTIVVTLPALGLGNTHAAVVAHGFQL